MRRARGLLWFVFASGALCACGGGAAAIDAVPGPPDADTPSPSPPAGLERYLTGADADAHVTAAGPGIILMGGGSEVDDAFRWWIPRVAGGDAVILRTSGSDGYNDYLYTGIGGVDSVETLLVTSRALADDPYVAWRLAHAEGIFLAGGDQWTYLDAWRGTAVEAELRRAWARGAVVGGTSAGTAVLGELIYSAQNGSVVSAEALADPYDPRLTLETDLAGMPPLAGVITDTHFGARDRMGRLLGFLARIQTDGGASPVVGLGIDEQTALVINAEGQGQVMGDGVVYALIATDPPTHCVAGEPLESQVSYHRLRAGDGILLPAGTTSVVAGSLAAAGGALTPADPY